MTRLLERIFIKNPNSPSETRTAYGHMTGIFGIVCNVILFFIKLTIGLIVNSISIMADSFNNLSDSASAIISLVGIKMSSKPADVEHPFGHERFEYITSLIVSFMILLVGYEFLKASFAKILRPETLNASLVFIIILLLSVLLKLYMSFFYSRIGKKTNSGVIRALAIDSRNDVIVTAATIVSVVISSLLDIIIDGYIGLLIAVILIISAIKLIAETFSPLLGEAADPQLVEALKTELLAYDGIIGCHDMIIHNYGPNKKMATIHAEVPDNVRIDISHEIIDRAEREIGERLGILLVVHMDPISVSDERLQSLSAAVSSLLAESFPFLSAHDYRIVPGTDTVNFIFDLLKPHGCDDAAVTEAIHYVKERVARIDGKYNCVINVETSYV